MIETLNTEDKEIIRNTNFLRRSDTFYHAMAFVSLAFISILIIGPFLKPKQYINFYHPTAPDVWNPPASLAEYLNSFLRPDLLIFFVISSPVFFIVLVNWIIKQMELWNGTKEIIKLTMTFKLNTKPFKVVTFRPVQIILFKRDGRLINLKKGDQVTMERTFLKRMIRFSRQEN